jgi:hypothetical protein
MELLMRALSNSLLITFLALLMAQACDRSQVDSERERKIATEQTSISAYSNKVTDADGYQARFVEEWERANEIKDFRAFKAGIDARVIPALNAYLAALKMMPTDSAALKSTHGAIVGSYEGSAQAFREFTQGLSDDNIEERYGMLLKAMEKVSAAEKIYRQELAQYYADNRVMLIEETGGVGIPKSSPDGAKTPKPAPDGAKTPKPAPDGAKTPKPAPDGAKTPKPSPDGAKTPKPPQQGPQTGDDK